MKETVRNNIVAFSLFWTASFFMLFRLFTKDFYNGTVDYVYTFVFQIPLIIIFWFNQKAVTKFFIKKNYLIYFTTFSLLLGIGIVLHFIIFDYAAKFVFSDFYFIKMSVVEVSQYIVAYLLISLLFILSKNSFELREKQFKLENENNQTQLNNLKAQLNPHFLFNSLNNIYSITGKENKEARTYIIKLSDALRYMLYKTSSDKVELKDEVEYIENYIGLEKLRLESDAHIEFIKTNTDGQLHIAPLILLPFIENCFKHCNKSNVNIKIALSTKNNTLQLLCENNKAENNFKEGGIGLANSKKRLDLIYPNRYQLDITDSEFMYKSVLKIEL